ncbi:hypothetical protein [Siccirubricoccus sp. G192]|uniref:hypothetical protein n=1 Tax=Siccirubricoccus sp. G192 TaxID=2849651 RepID=UPI001C2C976F|nr:hypothetical protein [Siccirubricoccus sp. G192]MBV1795790.1 hypothetical protein [Siccirubricoccus sp. G192]
MAEPAALRYRRYAALRGRILTAAAQRIPLASLAQQARALSLWDGKQVAPGDELQLALVFDLGVLDPLGGHGRGIDRQAKAAPPPPEGEEARMLAALQAAEFGLFRLHGPHPEGGVAAATFPEAAPLQLWDSHLGARPPGTLVGARIAWPEPDLAMTCGAVVPVDAAVLERLLLGTPPGRGPVVPRHPAADDALAVARLLEEPAARLRLGSLPRTPGFAALVYRAAIDRGLVGPVPGRSPG